MSIITQYQLKTLNNESPIKRRMEVAYGLDAFIASSIDKPNSIGLINDIFNRTLMRDAITLNCDKIINYYLSLDPDLYPDGFSRISLLLKINKDNPLLLDVINFPPVSLDWNVINKDRIDDYLCELFVNLAKPSNDFDISVEYHTWATEKLIQLNPMKDREYKEFKSQFFIDKSHTLMETFMKYNSIPYLDDQL